MPWSLFRPGGGALRTQGRFVRVESGAHRVALSQALYHEMGRPMYIQIVVDGRRWGLRPYAGEELKGAYKVTFRTHREDRPGQETPLVQCQPFVRRFPLAVGRYTCKPGTSTSHYGPVWEMEQTPEDEKILDFEPETE